MKINNPVQQEYFRLKRYSMVLILLVAVSMALLNYLWSRTDQQQSQRAYLSALSKDVEHQLGPLLYFSRMQQRDIGALLATVTPAASLSQGIVGVPDNSQSPLELNAKEMAMLNQLTPVLAQQLRVMPFFQQWSYLSAGGRLYQPQQHDLNALAVAAHAQSYIRALPALAQVSDDVALIPPISQPGYFVLIVPLRHAKLLHGYLLLTVDLTAMLQQVALQHSGDTLLLLDQIGQVMLAVQDGRAVDAKSFDGVHQHDNLQSLEQWPLALHLQPDAATARRFEVTRFLLQVAGYLLPLSMLYLFWFYRYKRKTMGPFARQLTHIDRLLRDDLTGVRHIPAGWEDVFNLIRRLKLSGVEKRGP